MSRTILAVAMLVFAAAISGCAMKTTRPVPVWGEMEVGLPDADPIPDEPRR